MNTKPENMLPYCNRPDAEALEKLNQINITAILDSVGVGYALDAGETEVGFTDWYCASESLWRRQFGVVWNGGARSLLFVSVREWGEFVTVILEAFDKRSGRCTAYSSSVCESFRIKDEVAEIFSQKLRSVAA